MNFLDNRGVVSCINDIIIFIENKLLILNCSTTLGSK